MNGRLIIDVYCPSWLTLRLKRWKIKRSHTMFNVATQYSIKSVRFQLWSTMPITFLTMPMIFELSCMFLATQSESLPIWSAQTTITGHLQLSWARVCRPCWTLHYAYDGWTFRQVRSDCQHWLPPCPWSVTRSPVMYACLRHQRFYELTYTQ